MESFFTNYFEKLNKHVVSLNIKKMEKCLSFLQGAHQNQKKVLIFGNGGSAGIASHVSVDLTKAAGVRTSNFNEAGLITCYGNDYGYDLWVEKALEHYMDPGDLVILISSSGESMNMINGAKNCNSADNKLITLTGFKNTNSLRQLGDVNLYVDSSEYNMIENTHQIWLLSMIDYFISSS